MPDDEFGLAVFVGLDEGLLDGLPDGKDRGVGRVDDGGEVIDPEHAKVRDGERGVGHLLGRQALLAGLLGQTLRLA